LAVQAHEGVAFTARSGRPDRAAAGGAIQRPGGLLAQFVELDVETVDVLGLGSDLARADGLGIRRADGCSS
jgi:hypothetical protein